MLNKLSIRTGLLALLALMTLLLLVVSIMGIIAINKGTKSLDAINRIRVSNRTVFIKVMPAYYVCVRSPRWPFAKWKLA